MKRATVMTKELTMTEKSRRRAAALAAIVGLAAPGCGAADEGAAEGAVDDEGAVESIEQALPSGCTALGDTINTHACQHGALGPYASVTADDNASFAGDTPKLDGIHTYYTVSFEDATAPHVGTVKFTPANTDDHVIYVKPGVTVTVKNKSGAAVSSVLSGTVSGCSYLTDYHVFPLSTSTTLAPYRITFQSASAAPIYTALEEVLPMRERWYQDGDGDTWGAPSPSVLTACVPPSGYGVKRGGDCNDGNASVYPGATETPGDGVDSNCNGNDGT